MAAGVCRVRLSLCRAATFAVGRVALPLMLPLNDPSQQISRSGLRLKTVQKAPRPYQRWAVSHVAAGSIERAHPSDDASTSSGSIHCVQLAMGDLPYYISGGGIFSAKRLVSLSIPPLPMTLDGFRNKGRSPFLSPHVLESWQKQMGPQSSFGPEKITVLSARAKPGR
ncbi:hypothetical protein B0T26DRAFT_675192 [Lasiosphaeria miniovina]|uniref:Uncharacterized protein n=1 Tax=Lasiosphaeria miniovina TaxID=1954250 RepID=A0AA40DV65_9PEZI|nr:uncharacterized protein B0T26DRAFT_675192 [Lasiosphaeria miniovina]KAK0716765.1 hypothetical protein B0T26DRAFT_675192 [Lasiosphaeria miniovina]